MNYGAILLAILIWIPAGVLLRRLLSRVWANARTGVMGLLFMDQL